MPEAISPEVERLREQLARAEAELDRLRVEKHFLEESTRHLNFLRNTHDGVFFINARDVVTFVNPYMLAMLGFKEDRSLVGKQVPDDIWADPADKAQLLADLREQGFVRERMLTMRQLSGEPVFVSCSAVSVVDSADRYVGAEVMLCNVTGKRLLERQRRGELETLRRRAETLRQALQAGDLPAAHAEAEVLVRELAQLT